MAGLRTTRELLAHTLAGLGAATLLGSALGPWVTPGRIPWPSRIDGVPDLISHPSDLRFRTAAALLGASLPAQAQQQK